MQKESTGFKTTGTDYYPNTKSWTFEEREEFMKQNEGLVIALVAKYTHIQDNALDKDDLCQYAYIAFWDAFSTYNPEKGTRFTTYAQTLMKNRIADILHRSTAAKRTPPEPTITYDTIVTPDGDGYPGGDNREIMDARVKQTNSSVEEQVLQKELIDLIYELLLNFNPNLRHIFLTLVFKTKTQKELAKELKCSQGKISMDYKLVRSALRFDLMKLGYTMDE